MLHTETLEYTVYAAFPQVSCIFMPIQISLCVLHELT